MAQSFDLTGTLKVVSEVKNLANGFTKREFVIEVPDGKYPQVIQFEVVKDRMSQLDAHSIGDEIKVSFDIRGREYGGRHYVNLNAWKIEAAGTSKPAGKPQGTRNSSLDDSFDNEPDPSDEIPF